MRWLLAVVVLVLAVVLGATLWKSSPRDDPNSAPTSQPAPETAPGSAPAEPARVAIPSALSARSVPYASAVAAAPAAPRIRVVALVRATGQPCAGAEVWYPVDAKAAFSGLDAEAHMRAHGAFVHAGADGVAQVPVHAGWMRVAARHGELYGEADFDRTREPADGYRVLLEPDRTLRLRTVDVHGQPLGGVPLVLHHLRQSGDRPHPQVVAIGTTDAAGQLEARHLQVRCLDVPADAEGRRLLHCTTSYQEPDQQAPSVDLDRLPAEPVTVIAGACGQIEVVVVEPDGSPTRERVAVHVISASKPRPGQIGTPTIKDGRGLYRNVPLGETWHVHALSPRHASVMVSGPVAQGETREVRLTLPVLALALTGRAVDAEGKPLANRKLECSPKVGDTPPSVLDTDAEGRFLITLHERYVGKSCEQLVVKLRAIPKGTGVAAMFDVSMDPSCAMGFAPPIAALAPGRNELGDVVLAPAPLLAAIRLTGEGVADDSALRLEVAAETDGAWKPRPDVVHARAQPDRFEVRGEPRAGRLRIKVVAQAWLPVPERFVDVPEPRELVIALERGGGLLAQLQVEGGSVAFANPKSLRAIRTDVAGDEIVPAPSPRRDGLREFHWPALAPGTYRVDLVLGDAKQPLLSVPDVAVRAGETTRDARLLPIDLRERVLRLVLRLLDENGQPLPALNPFLPFNVRSYAFDAPDGTPAQAIAVMGPAELRVTTSEPSLTLRLAAAGYRPVIVDGITGDRDVRLAAGPRLHVQLTGERPPLPDHCELMAMVALPEVRPPERGGGNGDAKVAPQPATVDGAGLAVAPLCGPGPIAIEIVLRSKGQVSKPVASTSTKVTAESGVHPVELAIDAARWRAALAELGR